MAICVVVASIGRVELIQTLETMLGQIGENQIVVSLYKPSPDLISLLNCMGIHNVSHSLPGASNARNVGISSSLELSKDFLGYVFPNDRTEYVAGSLDVANDFLRNTSDTVGIGTWINELDQLMLSPKESYSRNIDFLRGAEPGLIIPTSLINRGLRFDPRFGTGSESKWQSAESAKLLLVARRMGGFVAPVAEFVYRNPGSTKSLSLGEKFSKGYRYGSGSGRYFRIACGFSVRLTQGILFSLAPIAWHLYGKTYWRNSGLLFTFSSTVGRFRGLFSRITSD